MPHVPPPHLALDDAGVLAPVQRFDRASIPRGKARRAQREGYLVVEGVPIARVGPQTYLNADGSSRIELRLPEHVFADDALRSGERQPVTLEHPDPVRDRGRVDITNADGLIVGAASNLRADEASQYVLADLTVYNGDAIRQIEAGKRDLSVGYFFRPEPLDGRRFSQPGHAMDGTEADLLQTGISINHIAIVSKGRANVGDPNNAVRIRLDEAGNQSGPPGEPENHMKTVKITIAGSEYEVPEAVKAAFDAAETDAKDKTTAIEGAAMKAEIASMKVDLVAQKQRADTAEGALAAANAALDEAKAKLEEKGTADTVDTAQAADHFDLVEKVAKATGEKGRDLVALDATTLRRKLAEKLTGDSLEGKSEDYIAGVLAQAERAKPNAVQQAAKTNGLQLGADDANNPALKALTASFERVYADPTRETKQA